MPKPSRYFLDWDQPAVKKTVDALCADWTQGVLDLREHLIVVPTRNAGRRLREALAEAAARRNSAVIPGLIVPPEYLILPKPPFVNPIASNAESLAFWTRLLLDCDLNDFPALFPYNPEGFAQDSAWAFATARRFHKLRTELAEGELSIARAAKLLAASDLQPEPERWENLTRLEESYLQALHLTHHIDANEARIQAAAKPRLPEQIRRIRVFAVPDPIPLAVKALSNLLNEIPVEVYVHAPEEAADMFDEWGRPSPESWQQAVIDFPDPDDTIQLAQRPENQATRVVHLIKDQGISPNNLAIGVPDNDVLPFVEHELEDAGWPTFNPGGVALGNHALSRLAKATVEFLQQPEYRQFAALARHPDFLNYMAETIDNFRINAALAQLDNMQNRHLPVDFAGLHRHVQTELPGSELARLCETADSYLRRKANGTGLAELILELLQKVFADRQLNPASAADQDFRQAAEKLSQAIHEMDSGIVPELGLPEDALSRIIAEQLQNLHLYPEREDTAIDLQGWLELAWEDAPQLIITGMNEGRAPAAITADPFLPNSARLLLGLSNDRQRFARDAFMLRTMLETRRHSGRVVFIAGKRSAQGDPLTPSRLLFLCPDEKLPERATRLFADINEETGVLKRDNSWTLRIPQGQPMPRLRVTHFRDYLACPFRFYLTHVLGMQESDDTKVELDALDFGTLCHAALEPLGDPELRGIDDPVVIETRLLKRLDELSRQQFGRKWPAPVYFQVEALRQRLRAAARIQAQLHADGWEIIETELSLGSDGRTALAGMPISGRIDRIDRHPNGMIRILDYKTSETAVEPEKMLWGTVRDETPEYARVSVNDKERAWNDLQLPLYALLLQEKFPGRIIETGYFHLPKALTDTGVYTWAPADSMLAEAEKCAIGIIENIRAGSFWPPASNIKYDDYERLFFGNPRDYVIM